MDPYAPMYASYTTYNYAVNNPVMINDPNGGEAVVKEGPYKDFWNVVLEGVKNKAWERGWYGGSWSEDKGENLFDKKELDSYVDSHKNILLLQFISETDIELITKTKELLKEIFIAKGINLTVVVSYDKKIMSWTNFHMGRGKNSSYILIGNLSDLRTATDIAEKIGWKQLDEKDRAGNIIKDDFLASTAPGDHFSAINIDAIYKDIGTKFSDSDGYPDNRHGGPALRLADWIRHEHLHQFYNTRTQPSLKKNHVMGTILEEGPTTFGYDYNADMLRVMQGLFPVNER